MTYLSTDLVDIKCKWNYNLSFHIKQFFRNTLLAQPWVQTTRKQPYLRSKTSDNVNHEVDLKHKLALDPLSRINNDLNIKPKIKKSKKSKYKHHNESEDDDDGKNKKKLKNDSTVSTNKAAKSIEQLRSER